MLFREVLRRLVAVLTEQQQQYLEALEAADRMLAQYMGPKSPLRLGIAQLRDEQMAKEQDHAS